MYADTHAHLSHIADRGEDLAALLRRLAEDSVPFLLDIGTKPGDLVFRRDRILEASGGVLPSFIHFSAGLWPDGAVIADRDNAMKALNADLDLLMDEGFLPEDNRLYQALGECGLDRYWNGPSGAERGQDCSGDGPGTLDTGGEEELFAFQLEAARAHNLPVIVHSRDAFDATLGCIRSVGWDRGVIHCWSYGIPEARAFLDRGWHISFPGNVTWAKKNADRERISALLRYVPRDRLLLETDAPYLTPAPHRGKTNTPHLISHTYEAAAEYLGMSAESLAVLVAENARALFRKL